LTWTATASASARSRSTTATPSFRQRTPTRRGCNVRIASLVTRLYRAFVATCAYAALSLEGAWPQRPAHADRYRRPTDAAAFWHAAHCGQRALLRRLQGRSQD